MRKIDLMESNELYLQNLKVANLRSSKNRKLRKVLFWTIGMIVLFLSLTIPIFIYNLNKPFKLSLVTNIPGSENLLVSVERGCRIGNLNIIDIEGYDFIGWYKDEEFTQKYEQQEKVSKNTTLYAAYQIIQFVIEVPINDAYDIVLHNDSNIVDYGANFTFILYAKDYYDLSDFQMLINGKVLTPSSGDEYCLVYTIENIREAKSLEIAGVVSKYINLTIDVDGVKNTYKVKDTLNLQRFMASNNMQLSEYNTMGLFVDENLTIPANLTQRFTTDMTVYTKRSTMLTGLDVQYNQATSSWKVNISKATLETVVLPKKYSKGINDGYITQISGEPTTENKVLKSIYLPSTIENIDNYSFYRFSELISITVPNSVTNIGSSAFADCGKLKNINMPNGIINIGNFAFQNCSSLTSILIPNTTIGMGYYAFNNCSSLSKINFQEGSKLTNLGGNVFSNTALEEIEIPERVTIIGYANFYNCTKLTKVVLPTNLSIIDKNAFYGCKILQVINIPDKVTMIGEYAFYNCTKLGSINLPKNITQINVRSFGYCRALQKVEIPEGVTKVDEYAFTYCTALTNVTFPNSLTTISYAAFDHCTKLSNLVFPEALKSMGSSTFAYCESLEKIEIPNQLETLGSSIFKGCIKLSSVKLSSSLKAINASAFSGCSSLTSITLPQSVTELKERVFENCNKLTTILILGEIKTIGDYAFYSCEKLSSINLTSSVTSMGYIPFWGCNSLTNLNVAAKDGYEWKKIEYLSETKSIITDSSNMLNYVKGIEGIYKFVQEKKS